MQASSAINRPDLRSDALNDGSTAQDKQPNPQIPFPAFQYHASLHQLDTTQVHPTMTPHRSPLSAELKVNTDIRGLQLTQVPATITGSNASEAYRRQTSSETSNLPIRTPSLKSTLSAGHYTGSSLSPASGVSSPVLGPLADITPLPSPLTTAGSPGPWTKMVNATEASPPNSSYGSPPIVADAEPDSFAHSSSKKRKAYQGLLLADPNAPSINSHILAANASSHAMNRSLSEYVPGGVQISRTRNIVVSGSQTSTSADPPPSLPMHREEYLAIQRGISSLPIPRPPTPPRSNRSATDSSDVEGSPLSPLVPEGPLPLRYQARTIQGGVMKRWTAIRQLGKGTFSTVMLATSEDIGTGYSEDRVVDIHQNSKAEAWVDSKSLVAVKICEHGPAGGADEKKIESSLKRELEILKSIHHPSLVHLKAINVLDKRAFLVLNYSAGGDLFELASLKLDLLVPSLIRRMFAELVAAVRYLHAQYIVHRDIKLENVLVNLPIDVLVTVDDWEKYTSPVVTLTDLGLGRWIPQPPESPLLDTRCGSEDYAAPELLMGQEYDGRATDAWALGVLLYAVIEGRLPFDPIPGARRQSPTSHRIARCEWSWVKYADADGEWDSVKGKELEGGRECVEGLLKRARSRWDLDRVEGLEWVKGGITVEGGLKIVEDGDE